MKAHHYPTKIMGCGFVLTAVHADPQVAWDAIRAAEKEMRRIEELISSWKSTSETHAINMAAGIKNTIVSLELYTLIERSLKISKLTCGAFDISGNLARYYWHFDKNEHVWLSDDRIAELSSLINHELIDLDVDRCSVFLKKKGMNIGFGGIGKGYAARKAQEIMQEFGVDNGLVNASGDLLCWGNPPNENSWNVKIPDPRNRETNLLNINLKAGAVVTSGSYENYTIVDGKRYSHIINPRTGTPVSHTKNVTVVCPDVEFGDALATALSVLPIEEGLGLVNMLNGVECIIIDSADKSYYSQQLKNMAYA